MRSSLLLWVHPVAGLVAVTLAGWIGSLGLRVRRGGRAAVPAGRMHRALGPWLWLLVATNWVGGLVSVAWGRSDLGTAASGHFAVGCGILALFSAAALVSRRIDDDVRARRVHPWLGAAALLLSGVQVFLGLQIMPALMLIDAHVHLLPDRLAAAIRRFFVERLPDYARYPHELGPARAALAAAGVARCWSLPYAHKPGMASALNRWMATTFADDPMVVPGGTLHPSDDVEAVLAEALDELRLPLLKLHCSVGDFPPDDPRLEPVWRRVSATGQPVVVHAGHAIDGTTTAAEIDRIGRVARRWPAARLIVAHCGAPAVEATLALLATAPSVHADLTPVGPRLVPLAGAAVRGLERRLLFGSDAPNTGVSVEEAVAHVRTLGLDPDDEAAVLGGTAASLVPRHRD